MRIVICLALIFSLNSLYSQKNKSSIYLQGLIPTAGLQEVVPKNISPSIGYTYSIHRQPEKPTYAFVGIEFGYDYYYESVRREYDPELKSGMYNYKIHDYLASAIVGVNHHFGTDNSWYLSARASIGFTIYNSKTFITIYGGRPPNSTPDFEVDGLISIPYNQEGFFEHFPANSTLSLAIGKSFKLGSHTTSVDMGYRIANSYAAANVGSEGITVRFSYYL